MQGHNAHAERPCNLALQLSLPRQIFCLRKESRDFCRKMFSLLGHKVDARQRTAEVYNIALLTCAFSGEPSTWVTHDAAERCNRNYWAFLQRSCDIADAVDEGLHHRTDSTILQRDDRDWPGTMGKIDRQYAEREVLGWVKTQHGPRQQSNKTTGAKQ